ncbi:MAG: erythromycin esterase family protein [Bryobacteraceae bacterium]|nr:erythromycin esterase family protein [Bryobacteraceae bacterium]
MMRNAWLLFLAASTLAAQPYYNLDFETVTRNRLRGWSLFAAGYELAPDTDAVSGNYSMRIRSFTADALAPTSVVLPTDLLRGKRVKISGWIRTASIPAPGYAAIWFRVDGAGGVLSLENMFQLAIRDTTPWKRYEYEVNVSPNATFVILGTFLSGRGTAWFDDLRIEVDGQPLPQGPPPLTTEPDNDQLTWVRQNAIPFTTERAGSGFSDLQPLKAWIGTSRVVGLGEATHGTTEFFRMKHRLTEFLANEMGFTIFSIEANMPESYLMNDYVLGGRGDPRRILQGMYFWTWNTQEVLDMVEWMREFNRSGRGRIQFTGFDMQTAGVAVNIAREFIAKADPAYRDTAQTAYQTVLRAVPVQPNNAANTALIQEAAAAAKAVRVYLEANYREYVKTIPMAEVEWAIQNARVAEQANFVKIGGGLHRDEMMAANTDWILQQNPGAKMVVWAHNYHVSRLNGAQGSYLSRWYGPDYFVIGFAFHRGQYSAVSVLPNGNFGPLRRDNEATVSFPGSAEYVFHQTGLPRFILDLRQARPGNPGAWLLSGPEFREIGSVATDGFAVRSTLTRDYDALIYFDQTSPSMLLPFN